jgi:hypothetical protein
MWFLGSECWSCDRRRRRIRRRHLRRRSRLRGCVWGVVLDTWWRVCRWLLSWWIGVWGGGGSGLLRPP